MRHWVALGLVTVGGGVAVLSSASCDSSPIGSGGGIEPPAPSCEAAPSGGSATVSKPELIGSLKDSWNEGWSASPAVADLDGDGKPEIVLARAELVIAYHADGSILWKAPVDGRCWSSPVVADLRKDLPGLEVAQSSGDSIYMFDAKGQPVDGFPHSWRGELRSLAAGDIDGDGTYELAAVTTDGDPDTVIAVHVDGSVVDGFPPVDSGASGCDDTCYIYNGYDQNIAIGDVNGDGKSDLFVTHDNSYNSLFEGTGRMFDAAKIFKNPKFAGVRGLHDLALAEQGYADDEETALQAHSTNTAPAIADLDGDGVAELVYVASVQNASQNDRLKGVALWVLNHDASRPNAWTTPLHYPDYLSGLWDYGETNIVAITNQVSVADIDPARPGPEMIFAGFDGKIHAVDASAKAMWDFTYTDSDVVATGGVLVADLSGDGKPEIVFATYSTDEGVSNLFILDGGGNLQHTLPLPGRGAMPVPTIADADGDGTLDIVVSLKDSEDGAPQAQIYKVASATDNCVLWGTGRRDYLRDGYLPPSKK
ncbi:MAG: VCBS repeat-containing protein [Polyangiaceae bacterium]